jgi:hypothetical protein
MPLCSINYFPFSDEIRQIVIMTNSLLQCLGRFLKGLILGTDYVLNNGIGAMKEPEDHRTSLDAERRSETQERLPLGGLILASEWPAKEISIEEVYAHAETS